MTCIGCCLENQQSLDEQRLPQTESVADREAAKVISGFVGTLGRAKGGLGRRESLDVIPSSARSVLLRASRYEDEIAAHGPDLSWDLIDQATMSDASCVWPSVTLRKAAGSPHPGRSDSTLPGRMAPFASGSETRP